MHTAPVWMLFFKKLTEKYFAVVTKFKADVSVSIITINEKKTYKLIWNT